MTLVGRSYIVTGAASGIGFGVTEMIASLGGTVVMVDLDQSRLDQARDAAIANGAKPGALAILAADVAADGAGDRMVEAASSAFGQLDGLVTCAGVIEFHPMLELKPATWDRTLSINLKGTFFTVQAVANALIAAGKGGAIVTFSSTSAHGPRPGNVDYGISKIGVDHLTRSFALQLAPSNIRVNAVSPGPIETPMFDTVDRERSKSMGKEPGAAREATLKALPLKRFGTPSDIANGVCFLLSDKSSYVTGQIIEFDGGWTLANT